MALEGQWGQPDPRGPPDRPTAFVTKMIPGAEVPAKEHAAIDYGYLSLPAGSYIITATLTFRNEANFAFQDNAREVKCLFVDQMGAY